jgi:hypothetical protein
VHAVRLVASRCTDKPAALRLIERAGMPSQDTHPTDCPGPHGIKVVRPPAGLLLTNQKIVLWFVGRHPMRAGLACTSPSCVPHSLR